MGGGTPVRAGYQCTCNQFYQGDGYTCTCKYKFGHIFFWGGGGGGAPKSAGYQCTYSQLYQGDGYTCTVETC